MAAEELAHALEPQLALAAVGEVVYLELLLVPAL
jgi:hypothetical protein